MITYKSILKISIAIIIILLGLTAVAPEWLELKDMIIAEHRPNKMDYTLEAPTHIVDQTWDYLIKKASFIHHLIVGENPNLTGWFSTILNGLWSVYAVVLYIIFMTFSSLTFLAFNHGFKKIYQPTTSLSKGLFYFITLIISLSFSLLVWFLIRTLIS